MEEEKNNFDNLFEDAKDYIEKKIELSKLQAIDKGSEIAGSATVGLLLLLFFTMVFFFSSIALAFYLAEVTGKNYLGFLSVAGIYLVIAIIVYLARESWIHTPMTNLFIRKMLKEDEDN